MYFFYLDESGNRDPRFQQKLENGQVKHLDHLYVLTAVGFWEGKWARFDREIANLKLELADFIYRRKNIRLSLADCEVKSTTMRLPIERKESPFLSNLPDSDLLRITETFYSQIEKQHMAIFSVVIDKRELKDFMTPEKLHKKAYELLLERIEQFLYCEHPKQLGLIVVDDTERQLNQAVAMKHAYFQREGNKHTKFHHIVEYPFFTDSRLSNGIQLADLCCYNVYRAFRNGDFAYPFFQRMLPRMYNCKKSHRTRLDGLKVWPETSPLVEFAQDGHNAWLQPNQIRA